MQILSASGLAQTYFNSSRSVPSKSIQSSGQEVASSSTMVSISAAARQAGIADRPDSVENYRLPSWMVSLVPPSTIMKNMDGLIEESRVSGEFLNKLTADGDYSDTDRARMKMFIDANSPRHAAWRAEQAFNESHRNELAEYGGYLDEAWSASLREQGVESRRDYVDKVLGAPEGNIALRNGVVEKLLANPRAVQLMGIFGIEQPALV